MQIVVFFYQMYRGSVSVAEHARTDGEAGLQHYFE